MSLWEVVVPFDPKMLKNVDFKFSIRTVFCNSQQSILTLHSIHSTSNPSLYCGYEHWPCTLFIILSVTSWLMIVFRLSITKEWRESKIWTTHMNSLRRPLSPRKTSLLASMCSSLVSWFEIYLGAHIIFWNIFTEERKESYWLIFSCGQHHSQPYRCVCYPTEVCFDMLNFYLYVGNFHVLYYWSKKYYWKHTEKPDLWFVMSTGGALTRPMT